MNVNKIKSYIQSKLNTRVVIVSLQNRNREDRYVGVINNVYRHLFTIRLDNGKSKSFSYVDILIGNVHVYI